MNTLFPTEPIGLQSSRNDGTPITGDVVLDGVRALREGRKTYPDLPQTFDGATYDPAKDGPRLAGQLDRVRDLMADGRWRTLAEIATAVGGSEAGVSARLRDLRKERFGGHTVERKRIDGGLWAYRVSDR